MSSWRIGLDTVAQLREVRGESAHSTRTRGSQSAVSTSNTDGGISQDGLTKFADKITKWIPGDAFALYLPGVAYFAEPNPWWLAIMTIVAGLLVVGSAFAAGEKIHKEIWVAAVLAMIAFAIWSLSIPSSGWQAISIIQENRFVVSLCGAVAGCLFALIAEGVTRRMARSVVN